MFCLIFATLFPVNVFALCSMISSKFVPQFDPSAINQFQCHLLLKYFFFFPSLFPKSFFFLLNTSTSSSSSSSSSPPSPPSSPPSSLFHLPLPGWSKLWFLPWRPQWSSDYIVFIVFTVFSLMTFKDCGSVLCNGQDFQYKLWWVSSPNLLACFCQ